MAKLVAYKPVKSASDLYQTSQNTNYARDQTTGELFLKSGANVRTLLTEQFKTAFFEQDDGTAVDTLTTILTVPAGKTFLLIGASLQISTLNANTFNVKGRLRIGSRSILIGYGSEIPGNGYSISQNLNTIVPIAENTVIRVDSDSPNLRATASIFGYLINNAEYFPAA